MSVAYTLWVDMLKGISAKAKISLVRRCGCAKDVYQRRKENGLDADFDSALSMEEYMMKNNINVASFFDVQYPSLLRETIDPPYCLYYKGSFGILQKPCIAVVGARKASNYGSWAAFQLGAVLSEAGATVVSGMAYGVDTSAHQGALSRHGTTAAVLGCGVDICYPAANRKLRDDILQEGLILSEYMPKTQPKPYQFPRRNRIISGLCLGTVIAEAGLSSGSLITAETAAEQGREVFAIPGNINQSGSIGCNKLIQDGAFPVVVPGDVLEQLHIQSTECKSEENMKLGRAEQEIVDIVKKEGEISLNQLAGFLKKSAATAAGLVTILEMKGILQTSFGKIYIAKS